MIVTKNPGIDATFTLSWSKYFYTQQKSERQNREETIDAWILRTEKYKNLKTDISEYDRLAYFQ